MINLYDKNCTDFNNNGLVVLGDCKSCFDEEKLNDAYELTLEYPLDKRGKWQYLIEGNIIKADGQLFRIYHKVKTLSGIQLNARHVFYDLLGNFLEDVRPENQNGAGALDWILTHAQYAHPFTSMSDIEHIDTAYYQAKNPVEAILGTDDQSFVNRWGGEIVRDNFTVKMLQARGMDRDVLVSYGKNIVGIEEDINLDGIITRIYPVGKDGLILPEKYIDSPYINNYPYPKVKKIEFSDCDTEDSLRTAARSYFTDTQCDIPSANYKIDFLELTKTVEYKNYTILETVYLGDIVTVRHNKLNIDLKCKVIRIKKNILTGRIEEVELGNFKPNLASTFTSLQQSVNDVSAQQVQDKSDLQKAIDNATNQINSALGGYVLKRNGELLIMDTQDPNTAIKIWRWNQGGLGYSSTGYNGPFRTAITADGHIVADFMDTGTLIAGLIKTGILQSKTGKWVLNLDGESINLGGKLIFDGTNLTLNADAVRLALGLIGGNNLWKDGDFEFDIPYSTQPFNIDWWGQPGGYGVNGSKALDVLTSNKTDDSFFAIMFPNPGAGTYMCSFYCKLDNYNSPDWIAPVGIQENGGSWRFFGTANANQYGTGLTGNYQRFIFKVTIPSDAYSELRFLFRPANRSGNSCFYDRVQLEEGENVTAWSPNANELKSNIVEINDSHLRATFQDGSYSEMNSQGFAHHNGTTSHDYHYLLYPGIATFTSTTTYVVIQLPDEFKGKDFQVIVCLHEATAGYNSSYALQQLFGYVRTKDIVNGTFELDGNGSRINTGTNAVDLSVGITVDYIVIA